MYKLQEPDKGWAWMVALSACVINMILSGLARMSGYLYVAVMKTYGCSREEATFPFALRYSIRDLSGPLVGVIGTRFGIRTVTFFGGLMAASGAVLCSVAPNIIWLAICWGGIHGMGFAFATTLFQVAINQYFRKYRATASGIALSGACVSSMVFPILIEGILDMYGLMGGFLILGGMIMHVLPFSLLLSVPQWVKYPKTYARLWALKNAASASVNTISISVDDSDASVKKDGYEEKAGGELARTTSLSNCPLESIYVCNISSRDFKNQGQSGVFGSVVELVRKSAETNENVVCTAYRKKCNYSKKTPAPKKQCSENSSSSGVYSISSQVDGIVNNMTTKEKPVLDTASEKIQVQSTQSISQSIKSILVLYQNPMYLLISICVLTYVIIFVPILTVIVDYSIDKGIPESNSKYLINAMAIGDLTGRLCFGWVTDSKLMTLPAFMLSVCVLQGVFIALIPFATSLTYFMILLIFYGMAAGSILVIFPVLVFQYVDYNSLSVGIACEGFLSAIVSFVIPSMIGHFRDEIGSYDEMFFLTGGMSIVSGGLWLLEPIMMKYYYGSQEKNKNNDVITQNFKSLVIETEKKPS